MPDPPTRLFSGGAPRAGKLHPRTEVAAAALPAWRCEDADVDAAVQRALVELVADPALRAEKRLPV